MTPTLVQHNGLRPRNGGLRVQLMAQSGQISQFRHQCAEAFDALGRNGSILHWHGGMRKQVPDRTEPQLDHAHALLSVISDALPSASRRLRLVQVHEQGTQGAFP